MRGLLVGSALLLAGAMTDGGNLALAGSAASPSASTELSSQMAPQQRARTRIRVTPARGTGKLVRECDFRLAREVRANGTYVVPRQRCWWARQR